MRRWHVTRRHARASAGSCAAPGPLEAAGCLVHFAAPLTVDVVGGANVYVLTDAGRRGWLRVRDLVAYWRRAATPPRSALASPDGSHLAT